MLAVYLVLPVLTCALPIFFTNPLLTQALIVGVGSLSASTPYLAIILAAIIGKLVYK